MKPQIISSPSKVFTRVGFAVVSLCWLFSAPVRAEIITFEEHQTGWPGIAAPYHRLSWNKFFVYSKGEFSSPNGYAVAVSSGTQAAYTAVGQDAGIMSGLFNLNSAHVAAAWRDGLQLCSRGFLSGSLVYSNTYELSAVSGTQIHFNYVGVDSVIFSASGGSHHPGYDNWDETSFGIDDLDVDVISTVIIRTQPTNCACVAGDLVAFAVSPSGVPPFTYQWRLNGSNLLNATNSSLVFTNVQPFNNGEYSVVVSSGYESVISSNATLRVTPSVPRILIQPSNQVAGAFCTPRIAVVVVGSEPLVLQWQFNGADLAGATNDVLTLPNVQVTNEGSYTLVASNALGVASTTPVFLDVIGVEQALNTVGMEWKVAGELPWFVQTNFTHDGYAAAQSGAVGPNEQSILRTTVTGPGTLSFWWEMKAYAGDAYLGFAVDGVQQGWISGSTGWKPQAAYIGSGVHTIEWILVGLGTLISTRDAGRVDEVSFIPGGVRPLVDLNPSNLVIVVGASLIFTASAVGTPPLAYQWQLDGTNLVGETNASLSLTNVQYDKEGSYGVLISNAYGMTNTTTARLDVVDLPEALNGTNLTWTGGGSIAWFPQTSVTHDGVAALQSGYIAPGQQSVLQATVNGPGTLVFWWTVYSQTNADWLSFSVDGIEHERSSGEVQWRQKTVFLTPGEHTLMWNTFKNSPSWWGGPMAWLDEVSFAEGPTAASIVLGPSDQFAIPFSDVTFTVVAQGTPPLNYRWLFNGQEIPGATNATLTIPRVDYMDRGSYAVFVTNDYGGGLSGEAKLHWANVYAWGAGASNVFGHPNYGQSVVPVVAATAVSAGGMHNLALKPDGGVAAWGWNNYSQTNVPSSLSNVTAISAGLYHSVAVRSSGTVAQWGSLQYGLASVPATATNIVAISAGFYHNLALRSDGTVVAWGAGPSYNYFSPHFRQSVVPVGLSNVLAVAAGGCHSLALKTDGTVTAWGLNTSGQTNVPSWLTNVVAIAAGGSNSLALRTDGTVVAWGDSTHGQSSVPVGLSNVVSISAGVAHALALKSDGTLVAWGLNTSGQTNVPASLTNIIAISAGGYHNVCIRNVGDVSILKHPASQTVPEREIIRLEVAALGAPPLTFQWLFEDADIPNATNDALVIPTAQFTHSGAYRVVVSNAFGAVTSSLASVTVVDRFPFFVAQPVSRFVVPNADAVFTASTTGLPPIQYQWLFNDAILPGQTNATLVVKNAQLAHQGFYSVIASNVLGMAVSSNAFLDVIDLGEALDATNLVWSTSGNSPWFLQAEVTHHGLAAAGCMATNSQGAILKTTVEGPGILTFWWRREYSNGTYAFSDNGTNRYQMPLASGVWQQVRSSLSSGTHVLQWTSSGYSSWWVNDRIWLDDVSYVPGPALALLGMAPASATNGAGSDVTLTVQVEGTPSLCFQWYFAGEQVPGAKFASLTLKNVQPNHTGLYSVMVTNDFGWTNASAYLAVTAAPPSMLIQPAHQEMVPGGTVVFAPDARGSEPLSYQWQFNGEDIAGATNPSLVVSNVRTNDAGQYRVRASNVYGTVVSSNATLALARTVIVGWGKVFTSSPNPPLGLTNVVAIAAGEIFSVALRNDGTVFAWGWDAFGKLDVPAGLSNVVALSAGHDHGSTLRQDGTVVNWGDVFFDEAAVVPTGLSNVVDIAAGGRFNLALKRDGTIAAWGDDFLGALNLPAGLSNVVDITGGMYHGLALQLDGGVVGWGHNSQGQTNVPQGLDDVVAVAAGYGFSMALKGDGTVAWWGGGYYNPTNAGLSLTNVAAIAAGTDHALALRGDGTVVAWGSNTSGQTNVPSWLTNVVAIAGGSDHSLALLNDGSPYVTRQPWTQTILGGTDAEFEVRCLGIPPFAYQWQFNGVNIQGATNAVLTISRASVSASGDYRCVVSNAVGSAISLPAALTVIATPHFVPALSGIDSNGRFMMYLSGLSGQRDIVIYASTNLMHWWPILTNAPVVGDVMLTDPAAPNLPQRFYRAQER